MSRFKDRLYHWAVDTNRVISRNYHNYVEADPKRHENHRLRSWLYLAKLNFLYRVLRLQDNASGNSNVASSRPGVPPTRIPYLTGAESEISRRSLPVKVAHRYRGYDLISFDIFDTLILRPFSAPADVFYLVGEKLQLSGFQAIRVDSEREAREIAFARYGHREVTIYDIYEEVARRTGIDPARGVEIEFETEMELCYASPYMLQVFKLLRADGKTLVATSDMYLPRELMTRLLEKCGYRGFADVLISCEHNCSKRGGDLFRILKGKYPEAKKIVHFGDNPGADIDGAKSQGIETFFYRQVGSFGFKHRPRNMSPLVGSAYRGIVNGHLHNGKNQFPVAYEFGFLYGGIYLLGYCSWIHEYCKRNQIDKVLFLSRDGEISRKVFQLMYDDVPSEYFLWSRNATLRHCMDKIDRRYCVGRLTNDWTKEERNASCTIRQMFELLSFPKSVFRYLPDYRMTENDSVLSRKANLNRFLYDHASEIATAYREEDEALKGYLRQALGDSKRVVIADVGLRGGTTLALKRFIELELDPEIDCTVMLSVYAETLDSWLTLQRKLNVYVCSPEQNLDVWNGLLKQQKAFRYTCFETFHEALHPSYRGFEVKDGEASFTFLPPELENYPMTRQMQEGILDFCRLYRDFFRNYPFMYNISGADAIAPYRLMMPYVTKFIPKQFPDYVRAHLTPINARVESIPFREIVRNAGV